MKKIYICSLKFAPGLFKEFTLLGKHFQDNNSTQVEYLVSKGYQTLFKNENGVNYLTNSRNTKEMLIDLIMYPFFAFKIIQILKQRKQDEHIQFLFYNPHPLNPLLQLIIKLFSGDNVITVLHEPYKTRKERMEYGLFGYIFFSIVNVFQFMSIKVSDKIITMSPYGEDLFIKYFSKYSSKLIRANLLLPDQNCTFDQNRKYFSFVGRVNKGKGIKDFIDTINYCLKHDLEEYQFALITSTNIDEYLIELRDDWKKILTLINHENISDDEINEVICSSKAVLILHQTASQSGVLPLAYQLHTPIIARDLKAFKQYFNESGQLLSIYFKPKELLAACDQVDLNFIQYSNNSFSIYEKNFSEKNFSKFYKEIINA